MDSPKIDDTPGKRAFKWNLLALLCGIWFLLTGWMWAFLANLILSYPVAIVGVVLWLRGRKMAPASRLNQCALGFLIAGLVLSVGAVFLFK